MRGRAISRIFLAFGGSMLVCLLLMVLVFGCKDKIEEVGSEQQKNDIASKEQKQGAVAEGVRTIELTLHQAKAPEPVQKYQLLPVVAEQTDADAAPLYEKALQALPKDFQIKQISQWLKIALEDLPQEQVESTLQQFNLTMELLKQAAKCKQSDWPYLDDDMWSQNMRRYRNITLLLDLQMRIQIARGQYDNAIDTVQVGFAMAKHIGEGQTLLQRMVGIAIGGRMCRPLEQFIQRANTPNLYWALGNLPLPFIDLTEQSEFEDQDTRERVLLLMNRLDRNVVRLQCIEALRLYASSHNGKFPNKLSDITQVSVPDDPVTQKPVIYQRTGSKAFLESPVTKGTADKDRFRYELNLKE